MSGLPRSTRSLHISQGLWPSPISIGGRAVGWISTEVDAVISARIAGKPDDDIRKLVQELETKRTATMPAAA